MRQIENYRQRISGPLLDRIDIHVEVPSVSFRELCASNETGESSATIRQRVVAAREIQLRRFRKSRHTCNAAMGPREVKSHCRIDSESSGYLEHAMEEMNVSARGHDRRATTSRPPTSRSTSSNGT